MSEHQSEIMRIDSICKEMKLKEYTINDDLNVDVDHVGHFGESVKISASMLVDGKLPIQFGKVKGRFEIIWCDAISLEGCPKWVGGDFQCTHNSLTSLEGGPEYVGGLYNCRGNKLTSLKGIAKKVGFDKDPLKIGGSISDGVCFHENNIKNFDDFDCEFKGELMGVRNPITCLIGKNPTDDDYEFVEWFNKLKVVFDKNKLDLKRFKYLINMFPHKYEDDNYIRNHIHYIKKNYEIID